MTTWFVKVGTDPTTAHSDYADCAGFDNFGPFTYTDAQQFADTARALFATHSPRTFVYGQPVVEVESIRDNTTTPLDAVANWVLESDDATRP